MGKDRVPSQGPWGIGEEHCHLQTFVGLSGTEECLCLVSPEAQARTHGDREREVDSRSAQGLPKSPSDPKHGYTGYAASPGGEHPVTGVCKQVRDSAERSQLGLSALAQGLRGPCISR